MPLSIFIACALTKYVITSRFVTSLGAHDVATLESVTAPFSFPLRDTLDRFGRITIRSWSMESIDDEHGVIRIHIDGTGVAVNARHDVKPIPAIWILRDGVVTTEAHFIAESIIAAHDDVAREAIVAAHPEYAPHDLFTAVIDDLEETHDPDFALSGAMAWVVTESEKRGDQRVESRALTEALHGESPSDMVQRDDTALAIARQSGDCDAVASALLRAGNSHNVAKAGSGDDLLWQAASMAEALDDGRIGLKALHNYAADRVWNADLRHGFAAAELLERKSREFGWREGENMAHLTMGDVDMIVGDDPAALAMRKQAMAGLDAIGNHEFAAWALAEIARGEMRLGRRTAALRDMNAAVARTTANFHHRELLIDTLAAMYVDAGRVHDAERVLRDQPETHDIVRARIFAAEHRYSKAIEAARWAAGGCEPEDDACWQGPLLAGQALLRLGKRDEGVASLQAAIDAIESRRAQMDTTDLRRERFFEERLEPYRDLLDVRLSDGRTHEALKIAETVKARALLDTLSLGRAEVRAALTPAEDERRRTLESRIEQLNRRVLAGGGAAPLDDARKALEEFEEEMALRHPVARGLRSKDLSQNLDAIVAKDVAAIEYAVLPRCVVAFVVVRDARGRVAIHAKRIAITSAEIEQRATALHRTLAARSLASDAQLAKLYDLLVAPLRPWIRGKKLLLIVPDGALWQVPFQALEARGGEPLVVRSAIAYAPSFAALTVARPRGSESRRTLLAMGDASAGSDATSQIRAFNRDVALGRLPDAANEVRAIAGVYGANASDVYLHDAATETTLKAAAGRHRIIHLATHGIADSRWPMFSALVLAPTAEDDGLLEAREVADMNLDADLVVLSACDTGRGLIRSGEGVVGLSWAFLLAGCPRTVVSQWEADSKATSVLMVEFHRQFVAGATPAEALRRAQLALMRSDRWAHPYYWGNFIVLGNP